MSRVPLVPWILANKNSRISAGLVVASGGSGTHQYDRVSVATAVVGFFSDAGAAGTETAGTVVAGLTGSSTGGEVGMGVGSDVARVMPDRAETTDAADEKPAPPKGDSGAGTSNTSSSS